jgi:hypothetical protein
MVFLCLFISSITGIGLDVMKQICFNCQEEVDVAEVVKKHAKADTGSDKPNHPTISFVSDSNDLHLSTSSLQSGPSQSTWEISGTVGTHEASGTVGTGVLNPIWIWIVGSVFGALVFVVLVFVLLWRFVLRRPSDEGSLSQPINRDIEKDSIHGLKDTESKSRSEEVNTDSSSGSPSSVIDFQGDFEESKV